MLGVYFLAGVIGYLACALATARAAYGIQRTRTISRGQVGHADDPVQDFDEHGGSDVEAAASFVLGLVWPVTVPLYGTFRAASFVIRSNPPVTAYERERRAAHVQRRIRELEESLDAPTPPNGPRSDGR